MSGIVEQIIRDDPRFHSGGVNCWSALPDILNVLSRHATSSTTSVETGCGASTVVFAAAGGQHTAISPDPREHQLVREYCERTGIDHSNVTFIAKSSDEVLPGMFEGRVLDFAFIDGAHSFPYAIIDWHYITEALKVGGKVLVDDVAIHAITPLFHFMKAEDWWRLESIPDDRAALFVLDELPPEEGYTSQHFNRRMDYSFAPATMRTRLVASSVALRARREAARRLPWARDMWHARQGRR
jgi:precorrin-6B methylase 2